MVEKLGKRKKKILIFDQLLIPISLLFGSIDKPSVSHPFHPESNTKKMSEDDPCDEPTPPPSRNFLKASFRPQSWAAVLWPYCRVAGAKKGPSIVAWRTFMYLSKHGKCRMAGLINRITCGSSPNLQAKTRTRPRLCYTTSSEFPTHGPSS